MIQTLKFLKTIFALVAICVVSSCSSTPQPNAQTDKCSVIRAAFDIGSGTTKLKVGKYNTCEQKLSQILFEKNMIVKYKEDLSQGLTQKKVLSDKILKEGFDSLKTLKDLAKAYAPTEYLAVATAAFREAVNAPSYINKINAELGINAKIISQKEEGILGFIAGSTRSDHKLEDLVVWDIGGGSMQMVGFENGKFIVYEGNLAAVSFKDLVVDKIKNKPNSILFPNRLFSPNPLRFSQALQGKNLAKIAARKEIPDALKVKLKDPNLEIIGIGGVHYYSIKNQTKTQTDEFTLNQVESALYERAGLTDEQLGTDYAETEVTNISLVLGFMEELKIGKVKTAKINLADGLLASGKMIFKGSY